MNIHTALESAYNNLVEARYFLQLAQPYHTGVKIALDLLDQAKSEIVEIKTNIIKGEESHESN